MESESWSDDDDSTGSDNLSRSLSNNSSKGWDEAYEDSIINSHEEQEGSWNARERLGHLYLEYTEMCSPYQRVPLVEKIMELARRYPALMTLKSVDLSPASWMAVAWYPIYSIPSRKNERGLETCFLTYHTLSASFQDCATVYDDMDIGKETSGCCWEILAEKCERRKKMNNNSECMMLLMPPFGVATYKMRQDIWVNAESFDHERLSFLYSAAESWLKQLHLHHHHDFNFFTFHSSSSYSS
ncbi:uncharacterized protein G2W53_025732 [Senna tora]|uniref:Uncharacterized protein n=1 Tax=Senna tora TaxID=362788 RepID=A0A834TFM4_9FABA|nr:uncharacterized protein G2W53_025732 [Senna tora]